MSLKYRPKTASTAVRRSAADLAMEAKFTGNFNNMFKPTKKAPMHKAEIDVQLDRAYELAKEIGQARRLAESAEIRAEIEKVRELTRQAAEVCELIGSKIHEVQLQLADVQKSRSGALH